MKPWETALDGSREPWGHRLVTRVAWHLRRMLGRDPSEGPPRWESGE